MGQGRASFLSVLVRYLLAPSSVMHFEVLNQKATDFQQRPRIFRKDLLGMDLTSLRRAHLAHLVSERTLTQNQAWGAHLMEQHCRAVWLRAEHVPHASGVLTWCPVSVPASVLGFQAHPSKG